MIIIVLVLIALFLLLKTQNDMSLLSHYQQRQSKSIKTSEKRFEMLFYWNEHKITKHEYRYLLESNFVRVIKLFVFVYSNNDLIRNKFNYE